MQEAELSEIVIACHGGRLKECGGGEIKEGGCSLSSFVRSSRCQWKKYRRMEVSYCEGSRGS